MNDFNSLMGSQLASTILNGTLVSLFIVCFTWGMVRFFNWFKPISAATQYSVWIGSLLLVVIVHAGLWIGYKPASLDSTHAGASQTEIKSTLATSGILTGPGISIENGPSDDIGFAVEQGISDSQVALRSQAISETQSHSPTLDSSETGNQSAEIETSILLTRLPSIILGIALVILACIAAYRLARLGIVVMRLNRYQRSVKDVTSLYLDQLARNQLRRSIAIVETNMVGSPAAVGLFKGVVLLPKGLSQQLSAESLYPIIFHEIAHLERFDDWSILLQRAVESVFFFNPLVWFISAQLDTNREMACDDWVVSRTGQPEAYVYSIHSLMEVQLASSSHKLMAGLSSGKRSLVDRMKRVLEGKEVNSGVSKHQVAMLAGLLALSVVVFFASSPFVQLLFSFSDELEPRLELVGVVEPVANEPFRVIQAQEAFPIDRIEQAETIEPIPPIESHAEKLSVKSWILLLEATQTISSSSERASILRYALDRMPNQEHSVAAFLSSVATISSSSEKVSLIRNMVDILELDAPSQRLVLEAIPTISSESDRSRVQRYIASKFN